jgi:hypothetical protein
MNLNGNRIKWQTDKAWLEQKYLAEKRTLSEIGKESGVSAATVMRALIATGILRRGPRDKNNKRGQTNGNWKGEKAKYSALHKRLYKILGKADRCEECGIDDDKTVYNWANLTGKVDDPNDYASLCRKCHMHLDDPNKNRRKDPCKKPVSNILRIRGIQLPCAALDVPMGAENVGT